MFLSCFTLCLRAYYLTHNTMIFLVFTPLPFFFPPFFHIPLPPLFRHAFLCPWNSGLFCALLFSRKSIKQTAVLILWCLHDQRPRSTRTWVLSRLSGPSVSNAGLMITLHIKATMIMRTSIIHLLGTKTVLENSNHKILHTQDTKYVLIANYQNQYFSPLLKNKFSSFPFSFCNAYYFCHSVSACVCVYVCVLVA